MASLNTTTSGINHNKCMARLKKDPTLQCKNKKNECDFCKLHKDTTIQDRIDWDNTGIIQTNNYTDIKYLTIEHIDYINRFNIKQLKNTLLHYGLKCSNPKKKNIIEILKIFFKYQKYTDGIKRIQTTWRQYRKQNIHKYRGEAFSNRSLCNNDEDFLTFDSCSAIPDDYFVSFMDTTGFHYGFDIRSLFKIIKGDKMNPYNRSPIPPNELERINKLMDILKYTDIELSIPNTIMLTPKEKAFQRTINTFKQIDDLGYYTQVKWFWDLNIYELRNFYINAEDIWNYRAYELTPIIKKTIVYPDGKCFNSLYKIQVSNNINEIRELCLDEINKLIQSAINDSDRKLGAMYALSALVIVSYNAACSLPWLLDSVL